LTGAFGVCGFGTTGVCGFGTAGVFGTACGFVGISHGSRSSVST
jgi:hypothetical protein